jgi:class 3 adenylate cyclase
MACAAGQPGVPAPLVRWVVAARGRERVVRVLELPHAAVRAVAAFASRFGPTASAVVRWLSGAAAAAMDHAAAEAIERSLRIRAHPGLLVPHQHAIAVLAVDMRGFSRLTGVLDDTQYLADLVGEYLSELTRVIEQHRGVVFQYTGDGLLALFLPELTGHAEPGMMRMLVEDVARELHETFDRLHARWRVEWRERGRGGAEVGLGAGLSFGRATIGFLGPSGKKQFGVIGEPVNLAAFLCSQAPAGTMLVDTASFVRTSAPPPEGKTMRLRSKKQHHRVDAIRVTYGPPRTRWTLRRDQVATAAR